MDSVSQEARKVKIDVDMLMRAACPNCRVKGYVSVGGLGNEITAKCGLCDFSWVPMPPRACCICGDPFTPGDETQVLCPGCEALGIRCGCVMPWQSCAVCEAMARIMYGNELPF